jgi:hypothetical protein
VKDEDDFDGGYLVPQKFADGYIANVPSDREGLKWAVVRQLSYIAAAIGYFFVGIAARLLEAQTEYEQKEIPGLLSFFEQVTNGDISNFIEDSLEEQKEKQMGTPHKSVSVPEEDKEEFDSKLQDLLEKIGNGSPMNYSEFSRLVVLNSRLLELNQLPEFTAMESRKTAKSKYLVVRL